MNTRYCFIFNGARYSFPTEREAKAAAFRLSGKIGTVEIYRYITPARRAREQAKVAGWALAGMIAAYSLILYGIFFEFGVLAFLFRAVGGIGALVVVACVLWLSLFAIEKMLNPSEKE